MRAALWISLTLMLVVGCTERKRHAYSVRGEITRDNYKCGYDAVRPGYVTDDGLAVRYWLPCWDWSKDTARYRARTRPADAARLAKIEATQCVGIAPAALERSPFAQDKAIGEIVPRHSGGEVHGVYVVFNRVPGLTLSWMRRAITCHRARWNALGKPDDYLAGDPTLVDGTEIEIRGDDHQIIVLIAADSARAGTVAHARARSLVVEPVRPPITASAASGTTWKKTH